MIDALPGKDAFDIYTKDLQRSNYNELAAEVKEVVRRRRNVKKSVDMLATVGRRTYDAAVQVQLARKELAVAQSAIRLEVVI